MHKFALTALFCVCFVFLPGSASFAQSTPKFEDVDSAFQNAKKGILWGLSNIKTKKGRTENRLIANNNVIAQVKIAKEINGVCIVSTGYVGTTEVTVSACRTFAELVQEGYLDKNSSLLKDDE